MASMSTQKMQSESTEDWASGLYRVEGRNSNRRLTYEGIVEIQPNGQGHTVIWRLTGGRVYRGTGVIGARALAVSFSGGVMIYERQEDGSLKGVWILENGSGGGTENLVRALIH